MERTLQDKKYRFKYFKKGTYRANEGTFEILTNNNYTVTILENVPRQVNDAEFKLILKKRQRFYVDQYNTVNKIIPLRTDYEYYLDNCEHINKLNNERRRRNHSQMLTCDVCGVEYKEMNKDIHNRSLYHLKALAKRKSGSESGPQYKQQLDQLLGSQRVTCEVCGSVYTKRAQARHKKTKRHLAALAKLNQSITPSSSSEP